MNSNARIWLGALALQLPSQIGATEIPSASPADDTPSAVGTLIVQWTITGRRDALDCNALGAERFDLAARAASAPTEDEQSEAPCDAFQISMDLSPGSYSGETLLVDRLDRPVTLSVPLEQVEIVAGREVIKSIDFPVGAFL